MASAEVSTPARFSTGHVLKPKVVGGLDQAVIEGRYRFGRAVLRREQDTAVRQFQAALGAHPGQPRRRVTAERYLPDPEQPEQGFGVVELTRPPRAEEKSSHPRDRCSTGALGSETMRMPPGDLNQGTA